MKARAPEGEPERSESIEPSGASSQEPPADLERLAAARAVQDYRWSVSRAYWRGARLPSRREEEMVLRPLYIILRGGSPREDSTRDP